MRQTQHTRTEPTALTTAFLITGPGFPALHRAGVEATEQARPTHTTVEWEDHLHSVSNPQ